MRHALAAVLIWFGLSGGALADPAGLAPTGTLRAVYLSGNPAQAVQDPASGEVRGAAADLARDLGRRIGVPVAITPTPGIPAVIEAVRSGRADIGFLAYDASRAANVDFSQTYMLVNQTFLVRADSALRSVAELDRPGIRVGAGAGDSIALFLRRTLKQGTFVEAADPSPAEAKRVLSGGLADAFGGNRQRLAGVAREDDAYRVLPDDIFGVPQAIILAKDKPAALAELNRFLDEARSSGFIKAAIERSGVVGVEVAPPASR